MAQPGNITLNQVVPLVVKAFYEEGEGEEVVSVNLETLEPTGDGWRVQFVGRQGDGDETQSVFQWNEGAQKGFYQSTDSIPSDLAEPSPTPTTADLMAQRLKATAAPAFAAMVDAIRVRLNQFGNDPLRLQQYLDTAWADVPEEPLTAALSEALTAATLAGTYEAQRETANSSDFAEKKTLNLYGLAELIARALFETGDLGEVLSVDAVDVTPAGWTIQFTGETNGTDAERFTATFDGKTITYDRDGRPPVALAEYPVNFAKRRVKRGKRKNCKKGKPCKGTCIKDSYACPINPTGALGVAARKLVEMGQSGRSDLPPEKQMFPGQTQSQRDAVSELHSFIEDVDNSDGLFGFDGQSPEEFEAYVSDLSKQLGYTPGSREYRPPAGVDPDDWDLADEADSWRQAERDFMAQWPEKLAEYKAGTAANSLDDWDYHFQMDAGADGLTNSASLADWWESNGRQLNAPKSSDQLASIGDYATPEQMDNAFRQMTGRLDTASLSTQQQRYIEDWPNMLNEYRVWLASDD